MVRLRVIAAVLFASLCLSSSLWAQSPKELPQLSEDVIAKITEAMPAKAAVAPEKPRKMLVFWKCETFYHDVIPVANKALEIMGAKTGAFQVTVVTDDYSVFTADTLKQFDVVCLNNTTSLKFDPEKTPERCQALMDFVKSGKGLIGIHAAADNFYQWPEGQEMMGNKFTGHPWGAGGTWAFKIDVPDHPLMVPFKGQGFKLSDEIYRTDPPLYSRDKQLVLMSLDTSDPTTRNVRDWKDTDADTGITWIRDWGKGRVFYCSFGHNHAIFMNPTLLEHYLRGIQFAMGDLKAPTRPVGSAKAEGQNSLVETVKAYDFGQSRAALTEISDQIRAAYGKPDELKKFETALDEVLKSDAKYAGKQYACRELSIIGTDQSVPVLAGMLTNQEYSDMARYALERIPGEAVKKALLDALPKAEGNAKVGIVNSLGERGCEAAVAEIGKLVAGSDVTLSGAAISALGKIGSPAAGAALVDAETSVSGDANKWLYYDACLKCADQLLADGKKAEAKKLYVVVNKTDVPGRFRMQAIKGIQKSSR